MNTSLTESFGMHSGVMDYAWYCVCLSANLSENKRWITWTTTTSLYASHNGWGISNLKGRLDSISCWGFILILRDTGCPSPSPPMKAYKGRMWQTFLGKTAVQTNNTTLSICLSCLPVCLGRGGRHVQHLLTESAVTTRSSRQYRCTDMKTRLDCVGSFLAI